MFLEKAITLNIYTQACGLIISLIILFMFMIQKKMNIKRERRFLRCILCVIAVLILDIAATILNTLAIDSTWTVYINRIYLVITVVSVLAIGLYISGEAFSRRTYNIIFWVVTIIGLVLVAFVGNPKLTSNEITNEALGSIIYTEGSATIITYGIGFLGILLILLISFLYEEKIGKKQCTSIRIWMVMWTIFAVLQYCFKFLLICSFAIALGLLIMYISIESLDSTLDQQTGLFNWNGYLKYVEERKKYTKPVELIYLKALDSIKILDEKTLNTAKTEFNLYLQKRGDILPFYVGQEYIIVLKNVSFDEFMDSYLAERENFPIISTYYYPFHFKDSTELDNQGDLASLISLASVNINKTEDNYIEIDTTVLEDNYKNIQIENQIERAIKEDRVVVYYQPIYDTVSKKFTCAEALVRIQETDGRLLPPGMFIPIAEKNGMIHKLDEIVFDKICKFVTETNMEELGLHYIESNLSVAQLCDKDLARKYISIMKKNRVNPKYINLEITESAELDQRKTLSKNLDRLSSYGVEFSLDDYGTGYSNLNYVVEMPVNIIKFDKQMIDSYFMARNNLDNPKCKRTAFIMENSIRMFEDLNLSIVAEGVEDEEQFNVLSSLNVNYIQGYYFSRPIPQDEFKMFIYHKNHNIIPQNIIHELTKAPKLPAKKKRTKLKMDQEEAKDDLPKVEDINKEEVKVEEVKEVEVTEAKEETTETPKPKVKRTRTPKKNMEIQN